MIDDPIAEGLLPADWPGVALGIAQPKFIDKGGVTVGDPDSESIKPLLTATDGKFEHGAEDQFHVTDFAKLHKYQVTLPVGIEMVADARAARLAALLPSSPAVEPNQSKAVVGDDDRVPMGAAQGYSKDSWLSAVGLVGGREILNGQCTGIMIAPGAFLTAAHCLYNRDGEPVPRYIMPRFDPSAGSAVEQKAPWGLYQSTQMFTPGAYEQNNCHIGNYQRDCEQYDIALVRVQQSTPQLPANPWFFRAVAETRAQLDTRSLRNVGYPDCNTEGAPMPCTGAMLYGSLLSCGLGVQVPAGQPYAPVVHHDCDSTSGHSGGPIFYYDASSKPVLIGIHVATDGKDDALHPNVFKHISTNTMSWINGLL